MVARTNDTRSWFWIDGALFLAWAGSGVERGFHWVRCLLVGYDIIMVIHRLR